MYLASQASTWKVFLFHWSFSKSTRRSPFHGKDSSAPLRDCPTWSGWSEATWLKLIKYDCWSIAVQSCRFGPWMNAGFSVKQIWTFDCRVVSCYLAPLTTETANGSAGNAFRIGCIGLGAMRISLAVLGSYSTSWTSRRNLLKESKRIWNLWDMYNQLRSLTLPYAKQTSKVLAPARSSPHPSAIVSTGKSHSIRKRSCQVPPFSAWFLVFTNHGNNSHVRSWNTRSLEKPEAVSTGEKHRAIGISSCISEKYWELWKLTN